MANVFTDVDSIIGKAYYGQYTGIFDSVTQETAVIKSNPLTKLSTINWSVGGGTVLLKWKGTASNPDITLATLTGSGALSLGRGAMLPPALTTGEVTITTLAFAVNSTYTVLISGSL